MLHIGPQPSCQNKKCTCVNNRCTRPKISGDNLDCWRVELSANVTLARSRWVSNHYITPAKEVQIIGEKMLEWEPCPSRGWAPRPPVEQPRRTGKKCCYSQKSWGFNMLQFCSVSSSPLTENTFRTLSNKVRGIFLKNCVRSSLLCWICFCMHMCMNSWLWQCNIITETV